MFLCKQCLDLQGNHRFLATGKMPTLPVQADDKGYQRSLAIPLTIGWLNSDQPTGPIAMNPINDFALVGPDRFQQPSLPNIRHKVMKFLLSHGRKNRCHLMEQTL